MKEVIAAHVFHAEAQIGGKFHAITSKRSLRCIISAGSGARPVWNVMNSFRSCAAAYASNNRGEEDVEAHWALG